MNNNDEGPSPLYICLDAVSYIEASKRKKMMWHGSIFLCYNPMAFLNVIRLKDDAREGFIQSLQSDDIKFTHPKFKSANPDVLDGNTIIDYIGEALEAQAHFVKGKLQQKPPSSSSSAFTPSPMPPAEWNTQEKELTAFRIRVEDILELYHINHDVICINNDYPKSHYYELACKVVDKGDVTYYIHMEASSSPPSVRAHPSLLVWRGKISLSRDKTLFFDALLSSYYQDEREKLLDFLPRVHKAITHPDFKSIVPDVLKAQDISFRVNTAVKNQAYFKKYAQPASDWTDKDALNNFRIKWEKIDRLYYVNEDAECSNNHSYTLLCRMEYNSKTVYVYMHAHTSRHGDEPFSHHMESGGKIFLTHNPHIFYHDVCSSLSRNRSKKILKALREDSGIEILP